MVQETILFVRDMDEVGVTEPDALDDVMTLEWLVGSVSLRRETDVVNLSDRENRSQD